MNKHFYSLLVAQFLSAFADNAILFTVIAMVMRTANQPGWYVPALQSVFLVAFVVLAPWVGGAADRYPKARVLVVGNLLKAAGAGLLLFNIEPLFAYCIVGAGAAVYSPAKYGILPELTGHALLVKANSLIEGSTILAILLGMVIGAKVADYSIMFALAGTIGLFLASAITTCFLPAQISKVKQPSSVSGLFWQQIKTFLQNPRSRFVILGGSLFWCTAATLRVILVAWAPLVLMVKNASGIAELTLFLALGIIAGSALVPRMIPLEQVRRVRIPAYLMAVSIVGLSFSTDIWTARSMLFIIGMMGGAFIVPVNAALQELGKESIGSGSAVAMQGFFQNLAMLVGVGLYTGAASLQTGPVAAMLILGVLVLAATLWVSMSLPKPSVNSGI